MSRLIKKTSMGLWVSQKPAASEKPSSSLGLKGKRAGPVLQEAGRDWRLGRGPDGKTAPARERSHLQTPGPAGVEWHSLFLLVLSTFLLLLFVRCSPQLSRSHWLSVHAPQRTKKLIGSSECLWEDTGFELCCRVIWDSSLLRNRQCQNLQVLSLD